MKITQLTVVGLFEVFDHIIPLRKEEHITIIHGPNGFGKTALLKIINAIFNSDYYELQHIPFKSFKIEFDNNTFLLVEKEYQSKKIDDEEIDSKPSIVFSLYKPGLEPKKFDIATNSIRKNSISLKEYRFTPSLPDFISRAIPELNHIEGTHRWINSVTGEIFLLEEVIDKYRHYLPMEFSKRLPEKEPEWLLDLKNQLKVRLIQTQRLFYGDIFHIHSSDSPFKYTVLEYSKELVSIIKFKIAEYAILAQSLDSSFPSRLVQQKMNMVLSIQQIKEKLQQLEKKRDRLMQVGLLEKDKEKSIALIQEPADEKNQNALSIYVTDTEEKLSVFDEILAKIELLLNIINDRFLYKKLSINREKGFSFTTTYQAPLSLDKLSSGEQHELVMLYELLFKVTPNSLILIDEPEISLHVAWQKEFLKDLQEMAKLSKFDAIIATHSPEIINNRWDLTVALESPN